MNFTYPVNSWETLKIVFPATEVKGGDEKYVLRRKLRIGRKGWEVKDIWVFHGRDQGNHAEHDTEIYDGLVPLVLRSDHDVLHYDAWTHYGYLYHQVATGLTLAILARANDPAGIRPHWGIYINWSPK